MNPMHSVSWDELIVLKIHRTCREESSVENLECI